MLQSLLYEKFISIASEFYENHEIFNSPRIADAIVIP